MAEYLDFHGPAQLRTRGTVLVVPGRGESRSSYVRFGTRLAADSYRVRVVSAPVIDAAELDDSLERFGTALTEALAGVAEDGPVAPVVLVGSDVGAAALGALVARGAPGAAWWPAAVVLAALPGYAGHQTPDWGDELDERTHCTVQRGVLSDDPVVQRGSLGAPVPAALLDAAYGSTALVPQLLLHGDADPFADHALLTGLAKGLPVARLAVVHGAHHDVLNDLQHRSVAAEVVTFLEALRSEPSLEPIVRVESSAW